MKNKTVVSTVMVLSLGAFTARQYPAQTFPVLAVGTLDQSRAGSFADVSGLTYNLENNVPANLLGGFGSALAYASGDTFLAVPDRGPNGFVQRSVSTTQPATSNASTPFK